MPLPHSTLWRRFGRGGQCGFHIQPPTDSPRKALQSQYVCAKTHSAAPPTPFSRSPRPFVSPSGSPPENAQTRSEPAKSDNRTSTRERTNGDLDPRRNGNETYRKPFCLALRRQTAGVIERKTFRENREKSVIRDARSNSPNPARLATGTQNAACGARLSQERQSGHFRQDFKGYGSSRLSHAMNRAQDERRTPRENRITAQNSPRARQRLAGAKTGQTQHCAGPRFTPP